MQNFLKVLIAKIVKVMQDAIKSVEKFINYLFFS